MCIFFFKQKTAYEMRISDWSSDVCSSDLKVEQVDEYPVLGDLAVFHAVYVDHAHIRRRSSRGHAHIATGIANRQIGTAEETDETPFGQPAEMPVEPVFVIQRITERFRMLIDNVFEFIGSAQPGRTPPVRTSANTD